MLTARVTSEWTAPEPNTGASDARAKASSCHSKLPFKDTGQKDGLRGEDGARLGCQDASAELTPSGAHTVYLSNELSALMMN